MIHYRYSTCEYKYKLYDSSLMSSILTKIIVK